MIPLDVVALRQAFVAAVRRQPAVHIDDRAADDPRIDRRKSIEQRADVCVGKGNEASQQLFGIAVRHALIIAIENVGDRGQALRQGAVDRFANRGHSFRRQLDETGIRRNRSAVRDDIEHVVGSRFQPVQSVARLRQPPGRFAGDAREARQAGAHFAQPCPRRCGAASDAVRLVVEPIDQFHDFADRMLDRLDASPRRRAVADTGGDLIADAPRLAVQQGNGRGDFGGRAVRIRRQLLHFGGDHRKAAAGIARPRRLDRGVERKQVGLAGDALDRLRNRADAVKRLGQRRHTRAKRQHRLRHVREHRDRAADHVVARRQLSLGTHGEIMRVGCRLGHFVLIGEDIGSRSLDRAQQIGLPLDLAAGAGDIARHVAAFDGEPPACLGDCRDAVGWMADRGFETHCDPSLYSGSS